MKSKLTTLLLSAFLGTTLINCNTDTNTLDFPFPDNPGTIPGIGGNDDSSSPDFNPTIEDYNGQTAADANADVIGADADIYHELNEFDKTVTVNYSNASAQVTSSSSDILVHTEGAHVVIDMLSNSTKGVNIILSGSSDQGSLKVYGEKKFLLTLNGVTLASDKGPAINSQCKKRMFVQVNDGTINSLKDAATYSNDIYYIDSATAEDEDRKGCFFSEGNMIFSGTGVLKVAGLHKHGIVTDGYFWMRPGVTIAVTEAAKNAVHVKGDATDGIGVTINGGLLYTNVKSDAGKGIKTDMMVEINGGQLQLNTSGNAIYDTEEKDTSSPSCIKADGDISINSGELTLKSTGTGGKGISCDTNLNIAGGVTTITTTGGKYYYTNSITSSPKGVKADGNINITNGALNIYVAGKSDGSEGLESKAALTVEGGNVYVYAYDDGINAAKSILISGGRVFSHSVTNDGIDSNGTLTISGGLAIGSGSSAPEEAFDADNSNNFAITGGTVIGIGGSSTAPGSKTTQNCLLYGSLSAAKDNIIAVLDSENKLILAYRLHRSLSGYVLTLSSPSFTKSQYTIQTGGQVDGAASEWNGFYEGGSWSGGSQIGSFQISSTITTVGSTGGMGGGGFGGGGFGGGGGPR